MDEQVEPAVHRLLSCNRARHLPGILSLLERFAMRRSVLPNAMSGHLALLVPPLPNPSGEQAEDLGQEIISTPVRALTCVMF